MPKRNMRKIIGDTLVNTNYDLTLGDIQELKSEYNSAAIAILDSFVFGYAQGMKAAKAEMRKKGKA